MNINPQLQSVLRKHFGKELDEIQDKVLIISAYKLAPDEINAIVAKFPQCQGKTVENEVDISIIGGFVIHFGSKLIDLSVKTLLQTVQQKLYEE
ncbi:hypothetical protein A2334_02815 [Candidatus Roizmanbacteria bacterium RIFOXYB2_FULL_38_10]|uniref:Uncharacterized protein n=1 Tax=Candidatus Roizmanbacteria bacterium RIFOXYD1_FULL_38_12 TaxID=1802093 RepID=A0A1F7L0C3_9BACT|nr:MAG: hypothetical protein A3K47_02185 [Candidatus Roizmanbacteria bacterium RIFOXYA2_FULL_38_14]OGK63586.1 MAG: hypothetical protein A3K27_02185 [Candidatus Roizmanbacteria bacterium RIFOXYA1_FULL_37_12]OGK65432.1 MAG: hypothetical protein A3K38_02185 [Candidatus Roizmanbacteria bacterium RIFOXYB1_FULL_40_23]OGK69091.1 MAG: hypothetical protein A2334_02815 [Candidatus Roizmanbacteria bacterium RIFOXYB2_FULL_38_10]OGK69837.1 MAG: hypothetical protein A3K21_02190 [Candidatus Roizmanbacteria ba